MHWRRVTLVVLVVLAGYALIAPFDGPIANAHGETVVPPDHRSSPFESATAVARGHDGHWWVLEHTLSSPRAGAVYQHGPDWAPTDRRHGITLPAIGHNGTVRPMDIHLRMDGQWFVLGENSVVYVFDRDWTDTGRRVVLPRESGWPNRTAHSFDRTPHGWWVDAYGRLTLYDENFTTVRASYDGYDDLELGRAHYNEYYGHMTVGDVETILAGEDLVLGTSLADRLYRFEGIDEGGLASTTPNDRFTPDSAPPYVADLVAGDDGRHYVLRRDGTLSEYTEDWLSTGTARTVGSGEAVDRYPSDVVTIAPLVGLLVDAGARVLPAAYLLVALAVLRRKEMVSDAVYAGALGSGVLAYGLFSAPHPLRPLLLSNQLVLVGGLAVIGAGLGYHVAREREDWLALLVAYVPVAYPLTMLVIRLLG